MLWIWNPVPTWTISPGLTHQRVSTPAVLQSKSSAPPMWHHGIHLVHVKSKTKTLICALHPICDRYIYFVGHLGDFQHLICGGYPSPHFFLISSLGYSGKSSWRDCCAHYRGWTFWCWDFWLDISSSMWLAVSLHEACGRPIVYMW
jgi:hypothetical protein